MDMITATYMMMFLGFLSLDIGLFDGGSTSDATNETGTDSSAYPSTDLLTDPTMDPITGLEENPDPLDPENPLYYAMITAKP